MELNFETITAGVTTIIAILGFLGWKKEAKVATSLMTGIQKFGKSDEGKDKWNAIKTTIGEVAKETGVDKVIAKKKIKLENKAKKFIKKGRAKLITKFFG